MTGGITITNDYSGSALNDGWASRVSKLKDGSTVLAKYEYLGASRVVGTTYSQPNIARTEYDPSDDDYDYLDRFNRLTRSVWWTLAPSPDKAFYDCDIFYDRNSNITWVEDNVHAGFDVKYTMDDLDRLTDAEEGTRSGSSITSRTRQQTWTTLDHVGNWDLSKLDLNGDGDFVDTDELNETRVNNTVNELSSRDTDSNGTPNFTLAYDAAGNMTDDGEDYEYDAFYRLRKVKNQSSVLLAEYRYNGLGHMIGVHEDTDVDGDCDGSDIWFYPAYDEGWREVARYRDTDTSPKEQFVNAMAGLDGYGRSSYINDVVCRERDNTGGWLAASDGTLEERYFYCPNWRGDVSVLVHSGRYMAEWVKYSAYGVPFGLPGGDTNSDGDNDPSDATQIQTWINASAYDVRGDVDLDGDVDSTDKTLASGTPLAGSTLGWGTLSDEFFRMRRGLQGDETKPSQMRFVRVRRILPLGAWSSRDPLGYVDGHSLYQYVMSNPNVSVDPFGLERECPGDVQKAVDFSYLIAPFNARGLAPAWMEKIMTALTPASVTCDYTIQQSCRYGTCGATFVCHPDGLIEGNFDTDMEISVEPFGIGIGFAGTYHVGYEISQQNSGTAGFMMCDAPKIGKICELQLTVSVTLKVETPLMTYSSTMTDTELLRSECCCEDEIIGDPIEQPKSAGPNTPKGPMTPGGRD